jgi:hypothetical protein
LNTLQAAKGVIDSANFLTAEGAVTTAQRVLDEVREATKTIIQ